MSGQRRLAAIFAADMVGFSRLMEADENGTIVRQKTHRVELIDPTIASNNGRIVKTTGDGMLVEFSSVVDAVRCAVEIQSAMTEREQAVSQDRRILYRIGINIGDIVVDEGDIFGEGVNIASRIEGLCEPGGVWISDSAYNHVHGKLEVEFENLGQKELKNIQKPVSVYRVAFERAQFTISNPADRPGPVQTARKTLIAVMPFDNLSNDPEQDYFSQGMAEDLITDLSKVQGLDVAARNSAFSLKNRSSSVQEIVSNLGASHILEGSVRKMGKKLRINAQLIDGALDRPIWADRFDGDLDDIFDFQDRIREEIVQSLELRLVNEKSKERERNSAKSSQSYDLLLRARNIYYSYTPEAHAEAIDYLNQAIALNPENGEAFAYLSHCLSSSRYQRWTPIDENLDQALTAAEKAVSLDPDSAIALNRLGWVEGLRRNFERAFDCFTKAESLVPNMVETTALRGAICNWSGKPEEGLELANKAIRMDPLAPSSYDWHLAHSFYLLNRLEDALPKLEYTRERVPRLLMPRLHLACVLIQLNQQEKAQEEIRSVLSMVPNYTIAIAKRIVPYMPGQETDRFISGLRKSGLTEGDSTIT